MTSKFFVQLSLTAERFGARHFIFNNQFGWLVGGGPEWRLALGRDRNNSGVMDELDAWVKDSSNAELNPAEFKCRGMLIAEKLRSAFPHVCVQLSQMPPSHLPQINSVPC